MFNLRDWGADVWERSSRPIRVLFGAELRLDNVIIVVAGLILFIGLSQFVDKTRLGKAIRAVSMNEDAAKLMGVNLNASRITPLPA